MKKVIIAVLIVVILGLYFFTDETKGVLRKITGYVISEGKEKIKNVINDSINNVNVSEMKKDLKDLVKDELKERD